MPSTSTAHDCPALHLQCTSSRTHYFPAWLLHPTPFSTTPNPSLSNPNHQNSFYILKWIQKASLLDLLNLSFRHRFLLVWSYTWRLPYQAILIDVRRLITIKSVFASGCILCPTKDGRRPVVVGAETRMTINLPGHPMSVTQTQSSYPISMTPVSGHPMPVTH